MIPLPGVWPNLAIHLVVCFALAVGLWRFVAARPTAGRACLAAMLLCAAGLGLGLLTAPMLPGSQSFARMLSGCWTLGLVMPAFLTALTVLLARRRARGAWFLAVLAALDVIATIDAFVFEPKSLEVRHVRLSVPRLQAPLRVALIADLQTDAPGAFEREILETAVAHAPDLVLFAGDLIQTYDDEGYARAWNELRALLRTSALHAPLGVYVVSGDSEWRPSWAHHLRGTPLQLLGPHARTLSLRPDVDLTGLPLERSMAPVSLERPRDAAHIVVGHRPDFALGSVDADLMLAGHTHGGQVQIPGYGPPLTLSSIPRAWAAGAVIALGDARTLIVSRGLGMERGVAPRLRFFCRPELVIVDLVP